MPPPPRPKRACGYSSAIPGRWNRSPSGCRCPSRGRARRPAALRQNPPAPAGGADGDVSLVMMLDLETEVEMKLPGRFKVSPQIAGAIKAVAGVVDVQTL